jgi:hypothetical protein
LSEEENPVLSEWIIASLIAADASAKCRVAP